MLLRVLVLSVAVLRVLRVLLLRVLVLKVPRVSALKVLRVPVLRILPPLSVFVPCVFKLLPIPVTPALTVRDAPTVDTDTSEEKSPEMQTVLSGSFVQLLNAEESNSVVVITLALPLLVGALVVTGAVVMVDWLCWVVD